MELTLATSEEMRDFGANLARILVPGDLVLLHGDLGAGKTTLTKGIARGLGVRGTVTSPTFVIGRVYPSLENGPALVHVDAYRLGDLDELEALDLDTSLDDAVTVVEWGGGLVEVLSEDRLEIALERPRGTSGAAGEALDDAMADEPRRVSIETYGDRWADVDLEFA